MGGSGKEDTRQKMINLMYLVLLAMLAMNVSAQILESFHTIAVSLRKSAEKIEKKNETLASDIKHNIDEQAKEGNTSNLKYKPVVDTVLEETESIMSYLNSIRDTLFAIGQRKEGDSMALKNPKEDDKSYRFWMIKNGVADTENDGHGAGEAYEMRKKLNGYIAWANDFHARYVKQPEGEEGTERKAEARFQDIIQDPEHDDHGGGDHGASTWEKQTFYHMPIGAQMAIVEKLRNDVIIVESDLLEAVKSNLSNIKFKIDSLIPLSVPSTGTVVAGMPFESKLFVTAVSESMQPIFKGDGVEADEGGNTGTYKGKGNPAVIPEGENEGMQVFTATIEVPTAAGEAMVLEVRDTIKVVKPVIKVASKSVSNLFAACANQLEIDVPALGAAYEPLFNAKGGEAMQSKTSKKEIIIVPDVTSKKVAVQVLQKTEADPFEIGVEQWNVITPPKPTIRFFTSNGTKEIGAGDKVNGKQPITIQVIADQEFKGALPRDARYVFEGVQVKAKMGIGGVADMGSPMNGNPTEPGKDSYLDISLSSKLADAYRKGMDVYIVIDKIYRINYKGEKILDPRFSDSEKTASFILN